MALLGSLLWHSPGLYTSLLKNHMMLPKHNKIPRRKQELCWQQAMLESWAKAAGKFIST